MDTPRDLGRKASAGISHDCKQVLAEVLTKRLEQ